MLIHNTDHTHRWATHGQSLTGETPSIYDDRFFPPEEGFSQYQKLATSGRLYEHLVIQKVGARLAGDGPFISLHDSVFCRRGDLPVVESAFEHATKTLGFRLALKVA